MQRELDALETGAGNPLCDRCLGIVGGSKVSSKIELLKNLVTRLDRLAIGGGMANTFLYAQDYRGRFASYCEKDLRADRRRDHAACRRISGCELLLPMDVVVSERLEPNAPHFIRSRDECGRRRAHPGRRAADRASPLRRHEQLRHPDLERAARRVRSATVRRARQWRRRAMPPSSAKAGKLVAVAGGGDTVSALNHAGVVGRLHFCFHRGGRLPGVDGGQDPAGCEGAGGLDAPPGNGRRSHKVRPHDGVVAISAAKV